MNDRGPTALRAVPNHAARAGRLAGLVAAVMLGVLAVGPVAAASDTLVPACAGVNMRTAASTGAPVKVRLDPASTVTVSGTVAGSFWGTSCPGWKTGSSWYVVSHVNGQPVAGRYGVAALFAAAGVLTKPSGGATSAPAATPGSASAAPLATPAPPPATAGQAMVPACDGVNLRTGTSTSTSIKVRLGRSNAVTVAATVSGSGWSAACPTSRSGRTWLVVTHVNGRPVSSQYGVAALYAATGVLAAAPAPPAIPVATPNPAPAAPATTPAPTPAPVVTPGPAPADPPAAAPTTAQSPGQTMVPACDGVNLRTTASTAGTARARLGISGTSVTVTSTVSGGSWSTVCPTSKSGTGWYQISQVNGQPVASLYGVAFLYAAGGVLQPGITSTTPGLTVIGASTTFYGRGYGHGVGLSQYGARGRALAGQTAGEILAHYFPGTALGSVAAGSSIRVMVLDDFAPTSGAPLTIYGRGGAWTISGIASTFPADARLRLIPTTGGATTTWRLVVDLATGPVLFDGPAPADLRVAPADAAATLQLYSKPSSFDRYRGTLRVILSGATADVVNELPLEAYLRSVVPAEMPSSWPLEARIAQAIVARSYAACRLRPGVSTFDVYDDTRSQVYQGIKRESTASDAVVAATDGQVLRSGSAIANTLFHAAGGGATENNEYVFVSAAGAITAGPVSYLRGSSDRDPSGAPYDAAAPFATWQSRAYPAVTLTSIFAADPRTNVGPLTALDLRNRGVSGRLISVTLVGSSGTRTVSGDVFVAVFNANRPVADPSLLSTLLDVGPIP